MISAGRITDTTTACMRGDQATRWPAIAPALRLSRSRSVLRAEPGIVRHAIRRQLEVITYEGPRGGPGMQEMLYPTSFLKGNGLGKSRALARVCLSPLPY